MKQNFGIKSQRILPPHQTQIDSNQNNVFKQTFLNLSRNPSEMDVSKSNFFISLAKKNIHILRSRGQKETWSSTMTMRPIQNGPRPSTLPSFS